MEDQTRLKKSMRRYYSQLRSAMPRKERSEAETTICHQLKEMLLTWKEHRIHTYLPMGEEVNIWPVIRWAIGAGMELTVPKTLPKRRLEHLLFLDPEDLTYGVFGTRHPRLAVPNPGPYDVILVPGLAFDSQGNRLGYGAGYYDHFLTEQPAAIKVGICFSEQIAQSVPHEDHDIPMDAVITEHGLESGSLQ